MPITHDRGVVAEYGDVDRIFHAPAHLYTKALLRSIPNLDFDQDIRLDYIRGMVSNPFQQPAGCSFHPRYPCARRPTGIMLPATLRTRSNRPDFTAGRRHPEPHRAAAGPHGNLGGFLRDAAIEEGLLQF